MVGVRDVELAARETLEPKATATLSTRAASWIIYRRWCALRGVPMYPLQADTIQDYLRDSASAAPTRGQRFLESAAFAGHLFRFDVEPAFNPRARGIATAGLKRKRLTVKKATFQAKDLEAMENQLVDYEAGAAFADKPLAEMIFLGFILWCTHTRSRFGDATRVVDEPVLDVVDGKGFAESKARPGRHKTSSLERNAGKSLPLVACAFGVSGRPWAAAWLNLRGRAGLHAETDGCLMPEVLADWSLGAGRMPTSGGGVLLKRLLSNVSVPDLEEYGTHSCKATLLSWAAKAGLNHDVRRLLGGHAAPGDRSVMQYSRDAMAAPMVELTNLLAKVRGQRFLPDVTRSGRWAQEAESSSSDSAVSVDQVPPEDATTSDDESGDEPVVANGFLISVRGKVHRAASKTQA